MCHGSNGRRENDSLTMRIRHFREKHVFAPLSKSCAIEPNRGRHFNLCVCLVWLVALFQYPCQLVLVRTTSSADGQFVSCGDTVTSKPFVFIWTVKWTSDNSANSGILDAHVLRKRCLRKRCFLEAMLFRSDMSKEHLADNCGAL